MRQPNHWWENGNFYHLEQILALFLVFWFFRAVKMLVLCYRPFQCLAPFVLDHS